MPIIPETLMFMLLGAEKHESMKIMSENEYIVTSMKVSIVLSIISSFIKNQIALRI